MALDVRPKQKGFPWGRTFFLVVLLALLALTGWYGYRWYMYGDELPIDIPVFATANSRIDETEVTQEEVDAHTVAPAEPRYLSIPSLGIVKARVLGMGLTEQGALADPERLDDVAWYNADGVTPGSGGVMVMNGHNGGVSRNGLFATLSALQTGDTIDIERGDGKVFRYEVRENQSMSLADVNDTGMKLMMQSVEAGKEALNIMTCDGKWVPRLEQYDRRVLVRAVRIDV